MLNKVQLIGTIGKEGEFKRNQAGEKVGVAFTVLTTNANSPQSGLESNTPTELHVVISFNPQLFDMLGRSTIRGRLVYVEGKLHTGSFTGKKASNMTGTPPKLMQMLFNS